MYSETTIRFSSSPVDMESSIPLDAETKNHLDSMQEIRAEDRSYDAPPSAVGSDDGTPAPQERPAPIPTRRSPAPTGSAKNAYGDVWEE